MLASRWTCQQGADAARAEMLAVWSRIAGFAGVVLLLAAGEPLEAQERLVRTFGPENGLLASPLWALAQDSVGFIWIGTEGGLFRFDGTEFRRWAADSLPDRVHSIAVSPAGRIAAVAIDGRAFEITASGARGISPPVHQPAAFDGLAYDRRGVLWLIDQDTVKYQRSDGQWQAFPATSFEGERPLHVKSNRVGAVDVVSEHGVWRLHPDSAPRRLMSAPYVFDVVSLKDGRTMVLVPGAVIELAGSSKRQLSPGLFPAGRDIAITERNGTVWVSRDNSLIALRPGEPPEVIRFTGRITFGGPLLVDREGSLWVGSNALHQFPEPETWVWNDVSGLNLRYARALEKTRQTVWVGTWGDMHYIWRSAAGWKTGKGLPSLAYLCTDSAGVTWTGYAAAAPSILEISDTSIIHLPFALDHRVVGCAADRSDGVWLGTRQLLHVSSGRRVIRSLPLPYPSDGVIQQPALHDSHDRLWMGVGNDRICSAPAPRLFAGAPDAWSCDTIPGGFGFLNGIVELPSGTLWAGADPRGLFARGANGWRVLPMGGLPTRTIFSIVPSIRGGAWLAGNGILHRMTESRNGNAEIAERVTAWHGVPGPAAGDVLEEDDGTIWIAYDGGVVRVPADVRFVAQPAPRVALVEATVDGAPIDPQRALSLPHNRNRVELRFAALSFRDPARLQHQVRLGPNEPWSESRRSPSFRWVDLRPGDYQVEYRASLDGRNWSPHPVRFAFEVLPAWYASPWSMALAMLLLVSLVWLVYRARVAYLLGLERQRTRIAMDLHDEVGSGLASVGILSGVLAGDALEPGERRRAAREIAAAADELGNALSDIVWSLDPHTATLEELASRLAEHGERLCVTGDIRFTTCFPESWPAQRLDVAIRRNVLLVGLETLHNAVRHARASEVLLSLSPVAGGWELCVRDNGLGLDSPPKNGRGGHGLRGMRRRAEEIGAHLILRSALNEGTNVTLRFGLQRGARGRARRLAAGIHRMLAGIA